MRMSYRPAVRLVLVAELAAGPALTQSRLPSAALHPLLGLPVVVVAAQAASAAQRVALALECALGRASQVAGSFA